MTVDEGRLAAMRQSYADAPFEPTDLAADWLTQLRRWLDEAVAAQVPEPNAMVLATVDADGTPSSRTVLCKGLDARGLVLYTNLTSRKGRALAATGKAAITWLWLPVERQVQVVGAVEQVTRAETEAYAHSRPRASQLGAWTSHQSEPLGSRAELEERERELEARFADGEVPVPAFWGGLRVLPVTVEFWQGRPGRLHDRLRFRRADGVPGRADDGGWALERLQP